ncbi:MAG: thioredoxin family protein [Nitrospirae bacterium]|nr:thioredoxin family protein [Nitrospirota bacterium]
MRRAILAASFVCSLSAQAWAGLPVSTEKTVGWQSVDQDGNARLHLHFFWAKSCPHCKKAVPFLDSLASRHPWLAVHSYELSESPVNRDLFEKTLTRLGQPPTPVPAFVFCGRTVVGYHDEATSGASLEEQVLDCYAMIRAGRPIVSGEAAVQLPLLGKVDPGALSLPVFTVVIAGLDAFNPCAFFVLLSLLSLLVHARSRLRMAVIGGIFVFFSGAVYFLFMAAWLNLFLLMGRTTWVTVTAGVVAVLVAGINIKDYFWFKRGVSLSIPEGAKPGLFARMRGLVNAASVPSMIVGTIVLAAAANSYELLCTAGFPMVFTRVLTLHNLSASAYYAYLAPYNVVYVIPLGVIVLLFTAALGSRKLKENEGRRLKLLSGLMMLGLGAVLLAAPTLMDSVLTALAILAGAVALTACASRLEGRDARGSRS